MDRKKKTRLVAVVIIGLMGTLLAARQVSAATTAPNQHDATVRFWTNERIAKAKPRMFNRNPRTGRFARSTNWSEWFNSGSRWTAGGDVYRNVGRVFFEMGGSYWMCSASAVKDTKTDRSVVLTAAHCAYDETGRYGFARYWMFVPEYATIPAGFDPGGLFCTATSLGCWTADALIVSQAYATAGGFNETAVTHDYAFASVGPGGKTDTHLDAVVNPNTPQWSESTPMNDTFLFGYPAAGRYKGAALIYCRGPLEYDGKLMYQTYRVGCSMTGGSSGGPWLSPFEYAGPDTGTGIVISVNSYGYAGKKAMYGPKFGSETALMFGVAQTTASNVLVSP